MKPRGIAGTIPTAISLAVAMALPMHSALAFEIDTGNEDVAVRWDNTLKYSAAFRLKERDDRLLSDANLDDGDQNFNRGLVSNRFDLLSELDFSYKKMVGLRVSGAAWYDTVYQKSNDNNSPATNNATSVEHNEFTAATRHQMGGDSELLDAFVYANGSLGGGLCGTVRAGRHTLQYGESLFFGSNGIANAQGPVDLVKLLNVPGSQFKEILRPVEQLSGSLQITPNLSVGGYYQFKFRETRIPPVGSYLSNADFAGDGAERLIVGAPGGPFAGPPAFWRGADIKAKNSGQGGIQVHWTPDGSPVDFGFYAVRYHDKTPYLYLVANPIPDFATGRVGQLVEVYHEGVRAYGMSATTSIGQLNLAAEVSVRRNTSLVSDPQTIAPGQAADNDDNARYAVGNSAHAQVSGIYVLQPTALWGGGAWLWELAWNRRTSITKNPQALDPNTTRDAWAVRTIFSPTYYQVLPGLDVSVPVGLGYNLGGRSSVIFNFNGGSSHAGDLSIGLDATYRQDWKFGLNYTHYLGSTGPFLTAFNPTETPVQKLSYDQSLKDRDFISLVVRRAF